MGYETRYVLDVLDPADMQPMPEDLVRAIVEGFRAECEDANYALDNLGGGWESCKWYDHDDDLRKLSLKHPDVLFKLFGDGEESDDQWYTYYLNGRMQYCPGEMVFPEYDPDGFDDGVEVDREVEDGLQAEAEA